jgi:hypothetical protein
MIPHERSLVKKLEGKPFALIGVNSDPDKKTIQDGLKKYQVTWRSFAAGNTRGKIPQEFKVQGWPTLILIDHKGVIRQKWIGNPGDKVIEGEIEKLVKAAEDDQQKS